MQQWYVSVSSTSVGWLYVKWDNGQENIYRMGAQDHYDLQLLTGNFYDGYIIGCNLDCKLQ